MTEPRPTDADLEQRLARLRADYEAAKARLAQVGFTCQGSLVERYTTCNNPNCRCADPDQRHGPYYQLSWKQDGKTVSRLLPAEDAALYRQWIDNRRHLEAALDDMRDLSHEAAEHILAANDRPFHGPKRPRRTRRSAS